MHVGTRTAIRKVDLQRLKEGRGQGTGKDYKPWIYVQDLPATRGQRNRDLGMTTGRQHDLLSKLERDYFLTVDFPLSATYQLDNGERKNDIREQFPLLPIDLTIAIAEECGIKHPVDPKTKEPVVMTTDLVLTCVTALGSDILPRSVKPVDKLSDERTIEKLELERRFWLHLNRVSKIVTEHQVDPDLVYNIDYAHKFFHVSELYPLTERVVATIAGALTDMVCRSRSPLNEIAIACDERLGFKIGSSLMVARHLIASRQWHLDMTKRINPYEELNILKVELVESFDLKTGTR
jgi:TnsA endonuclease N terminal/TnsA endonuclease C terminal